MDLLRAVCGLMVIVCVASVAPLGCGEDEADSSGSTTSNETTDSKARPEGLRIFYALATPSAIDMTLIDNENSDNTHDIKGIAVNTTSPYTVIPAGNYRAIFFEAGTRTPLSTISVDEIAMADGEASTLILSQGSDGEAKDQLISDTLETPGENSSRYRFIYRGARSKIDLYADGSPVTGASGLALGQLTLYTDIDGGTYSFDVRPEGLQDVLHQIEVPLKPSEVYTIFIIGDTDPNEDGNTSDNTITHVQVTDWSLN